MSILLMVAAAASAPNPLMVNWGNCMMAYSNPRLRTETVEQLIDGSFAACPAEEKAVRQSYVKRFGEPTGSRAFDGLKYKMRGLMRERLSAVKQQLGY